MSDTTAPTLLALSFPGSIDVTYDPVNAVFTARANDTGGSGLFNIQVRIRAPNGSESTYFIFGGTDGWAGGYGDATYGFAESTRPGTYLIAGVTVYDNASNGRSYTPAELVNLGIATSFTVTADTVRPTLTGLTIPTSVNVSFGYAEGAFTATGNETGSGIARLILYLTNPNGGSAGGVYFFDQTNSSWSDGADETTFGLSANAAPGTYTIASASLQDHAGNVSDYTTAQLAARGFATTFTVIADEIDPTLTALSLPAAVNTSAGAANMTFTAGVADTGGSGLRGLSVRIDPPSGSDQLLFFGSASELADGSDDAVFTVAANAPEGTWTIAEVKVQDNADNIRSYDTAALAALGFRTSFVVTKDTQAPTLTGLNFPATVSLAQGNADFTVAANAADTGGSGVARVDLTFDAPNGGTDFYVWLDGFPDTWTDGASAETRTLYAGMTAGTYTIATAVVTDNGGNARTYTTAQLTALGFGTTLTVGASEVAPPVVTALNTTTAIDVTTTTRLLALFASATDATGVDDLVVWLDRPLLTPSGAFSGFPLEGTFDSWADGSSSVGYEIADGAEAGAYEVDRVVATDTGGNAATYRLLDLRDDPDVIAGFFVRDATIPVALANIWRGTWRVDNVVGTTADEVLFTLQGNDTLNGGGGNDWLYGGSGNDTYLIDAATDRVIERAGGGTDTVRTTADYTLGAELEELAAADAAAMTALRLTGNAASNTITGNAGNNTLDGGAARDLLIGLGGDDTYYVYGIEDDVIEAAGGGRDRILTTVDFTLDMGSEVEDLQARSPTSTLGLRLRGNELTNAIRGAAGADTLDGAAGRDTLVGLGGDDTYRVDLATDVVTEVAGGGFDTILTTVTYALAAGQSVEVLAVAEFGSTTVIDLTGNEIGNRITGNAANNRLDGGAGADDMAGGLGDDTYVVDDTGDTADEAADSGTDLVLASVSFSLAGEFTENLTLTGTADIDGTGNGLANVITGNAGNNRIDGGGGNDRLLGGRGNDTFVVDGTGDRALENADQGEDQVLASVTYTIGAHVEHLTLTGDAAINGTGNALANRITGNARANKLDGGDGDDTLDGGVGPDRLIGGNGDDTLVLDDAGDTILELAGGGTDTVVSSLDHRLGETLENVTLTGAAISARGNAGANVVTGNANANGLSGLGGNDLLVGGAGMDTLSGGDGSDTLVGGAGVDRVYGDAGADTIRFGTTAEAGDTLYAFVSGTDRIEVSAAGFGGGLTAGALGAGRFVANTSGAATAAIGQFVHETDVSRLWWDADGTGAGGRVLVATGLGTLAAGDIQVIA